jgi:hypothetical protein
MSKIEIELGVAPAEPSRERLEEPMAMRLSVYMGNKTRATAAVGLRRSAASGFHASGPKRKRDRRAAKNAAIRESRMAG